MGGYKRYCKMIYVNVNVIVNDVDSTIDRRKQRKRQRFHEFSKEVQIHDLAVGDPFCKKLKILDWKSEF